MQRRSFLGLGALLGLGAAAGACGWTLLGPSQQPLLLSARSDAQGRHYAVGYRLNGQRAFATQVSARCHDVVAHPSLPLAVFVGRRPSTSSFLIDTRDGRLLQTLAAPAGRHFNGHGVFHQHGDWLYTSENDTREPGRGVLGVYRLHNNRLTRQGEHSTHGIGPHQLLWLPDDETLVVANGGIRTEADSRVEMNLDAMDSSLVLMGRDGTLLSQERLVQAQNSIRHLAVASDGTVVSAQQYMGDLHDTAPLLAIKRPGQTLQAFPIAEAQRTAMQQYSASVAIHSELRLLALTAPRGNRLFIWHLDSSALLLDAAVPDCAGIAACAEGFVVSSGVGRCRLYHCRQQPFHGTPLSLPAGLWDNHLRLI